MSGANQPRDPSGIGVSTHVLDTSTGRPASAVAVALQRQESGGWVDVWRDVTNADGRAAGLTPAASGLPAGVYRLMFGVGEYFARRGVQSFYGTVGVEFNVRDAAARYHIGALFGTIMVSNVWMRILPPQRRMIFARRRFAQTIPTAIHRPSGPSALQSPPP